MINGAEYVFTNSFHGTAFSINLNKNFYSFVDYALESDKNFFSRITNLCDSLHLLDRVVDCSKDFDLTFDDINYSDINSKLEQQRITSRETIRKIVGLL